MLRNVLIFSAVILTAASFGNWKQFGQSVSTRAVRVQAPAEPAVVARLEPVERPALGEVKLKSDGRGHFFGEFSLNGRRVKALVDTGASTVAINLSTARRAGLSLSPSDFKQKVSTAGGVVKAAYIVLDTVEIGNIKVRDVQAVVLDDNILPTTLIGMTFMNQLSGFRATGDTLVLSR